MKILSKPIVLLFFAAIFSFVCPHFAQEEYGEWVKGEWFSAIQKLPNGFDAKELHLWGNPEYGKFTMTRISFNVTRNWEETRYSGKWKYAAPGEIILSADYCTVYTAKEIGNRWALLRAFDCDHLRFTLSRNADDRLTMIPAMLLEGSEILTRPIHEKNSFSSLVILTHGKEFVSWGTSLNRIRKGAIPYLLKQNGKKEKIEIIETIDSSGRYNTLTGDAEPGDFIIIQNKKESGSLD